MTSLHQRPRVPATPTIEVCDVRPAQYEGLVRWHNREAISDVLDAMAAHPRYPIIQGDRQVEGGAA